MFEYHSSPLLPRRAFYHRVAHCFMIGQIVAALALGVGMTVCHFIEALPWVDAVANTSMILSCMGALNPLQTTAGKPFGGCYTLFSGLVFITVSGIFAAPIAHRFLHKFHLEDEDRE